MIEPAEPQQPVIEKTIDGMTIEEWAMEYKLFQKEVNKRLEKMDGAKSLKLLDALEYARFSFEAISRYNPDSSAQRRADEALRGLKEFLGD